MLASINLSLTTACGADCIFCPSNRGKSIKKKVMSFALVEKIVAEIASAEFKRLHGLTHMQLGENGDAFLNPDFIRILRHVRSRLPDICISLFTNFQHFTRERAEIILSERLVDYFTCNIDGANEQNYRQMKKLELSNTWKNLTDFVEVRHALNARAPLRLHALTLHNYVHSVHTSIGKLPVKLKSPDMLKVPDDFAEIQKLVSTILDGGDDEVQEIRPFAWAERESVDVEQLDYSRFSCPFLDRVEHEAFIAPDGTWYACCLDSNAELILGNVTTESLAEIFASPKRNALIAALHMREFDAIGGPCKTVNCCQPLSRNRFEKLTHQAFRTLVPEASQKAILRILKK